jgi:hypothetical protein
VVVSDTTEAAPLTSVAAMDEAVHRRSRALLYPARIAHIEEARKRSQDAALAPYRMDALSLHAIDAVAVRMDLESGATWEEAIAEVVVQAARQHPEGTESQHRSAAEWLLRQLVADEDGEWLDVDEDGSPLLRIHRVFLLYETEQAGLHHLRARDQAINVLVDALDLDIDSAQHAAEARLQHLVRRGRHDEAYFAARESHRQSLRFMEQVRDAVHEARRDLDSEHWASTIGPRLSAALAHIVERLKVEERLKELIESASERADERDFRWIPKTIDLLDDCLARHQMLQRVVGEAGEVFLLEQQRQHLQPRARRAFPHPINEVLTGVLERLCGDADEVIRSCETALGARAPRLLTAWAGVDTLATMPAAAAEHGHEIAERHLMPDREPLLFTEEQVRAAGRRLESVGVDPVELGSLCAATEDAVERHALVLLALGHRAPELASVHYQGARDVLLAGPAARDDDVTSPALILRRIELAEEEKPDV